MADTIDDKIDELAGVCAWWRICRDERVYAPVATKAAILMIIDEIQELRGKSEQTT